jgi:hypothetical protein
MWVFFISDLSCNSCQYRVFSYNAKAYFLFTVQFIK